MGMGQNETNILVLCSFYQGPILGTYFFTHTHMLALRLGAEDHIYGLATDFTAFYTDCVVVGSDQQNSRLILLEAGKRQRSSLGYAGQGSGFMDLGAAYPLLQIPTFSRVFFEKKILGFPGKYLLFSRRSTSCPIKSGHGEGVFPWQHCQVVRRQLALCLGFLRIQPFDQL